jgi:drug/metabolite transporter (DMT)-like permease
MSLLLGYSVNHEPLTVKTIAGTALIMCALLIYEIVNRRQQQNGM